jgi:hypothetical protein
LHSAYPLQADMERDMKGYMSFDVTIWFSIFRSLIDKANETFSHHMKRPAAGAGAHYAIQYFRRGTITLPQVARKRYVTVEI